MMDRNISAEGLKKYLGDRKKNWHLVPGLKMKIENGTPDFSILDILSASISD